MNYKSMIDNRMKIGTEWFCIINNKKTKVRIQNIFRVQGIGNVYSVERIHPKLKIWQTLPNLRTTYDLLVK